MEIRDEIDDHPSCKRGRLRVYVSPFSQLLSASRSLFRVLSASTYCTSFDEASRGERSER